MSTCYEVEVEVMLMALLRHGRGPPMVEQILRLHVLWVDQMDSFTSYFVLEIISYYNSPCPEICTMQLYSSAKERIKIDDAADLIRPRLLQTTFLYV